jgi:hypothetical protein
MYKHKLKGIPCAYHVHTMYRVMHLFSHSFFLQRDSSLSLPFYGDYTQVGTMFHAKAMHRIGHNGRQDALSLALALINSRRPSLPSPLSHLNRPQVLKKTGSPGGPSASGGSGGGSGQVEPPGIINYGGMAMVRQLNCMTYAEDGE